MRSVEQSGRAEAVDRLAGGGFGRTETVDSASFRGVAE
jgi:hypothetical protein